MSKETSDLYETNQFTSAKFSHVQIIGHRPILSDRTTDKTRDWVFGFASILMVGNRPMPVQGEIQGKTLSEALANLPEAMEARRQEIMREAATPKIIAPGVVSGKFGNG